MDKGFTHAAAIAYYAIVSMFPLLLLLIVIVGFLLKEDAADKIVGLAWPYLPAGSLQLVRDNVTAVLQSRESISVMSFVGLLWSASLMFDAINEAVNFAWGVRDPERYVISKLKSFLMMTILLFFVMSSMAMTTQAAMVARFDAFLSCSFWKRALDPGTTSWVSSRPNDRALHYDWGVYSSLSLFASTHSSVEGCDLGCPASGNSLGNTKACLCLVYRDSSGFRQGLWIDFRRPGASDLDACLGPHSHLGW